jgi:hypothetical protein
MWDPTSAWQPAPQSVGPQATATVRPARSTFWGLTMRGFTAAEAADLTAHLQGLQKTSVAWTLREVEHLLFLRALVERGRLES